MAADYQALQSLTGMGQFSGDPMAKLVCYDADVALISLWEPQKFSIAKVDNRNILRMGMILEVGGFGAQIPQQITNMTMAQSMALDLQVASRAFEGYPAEAACFTLVFNIDRYSRKFTRQGGSTTFVRVGLVEGGKNE
jgi:hypothetical protein